MSDASEGPTRRLAVAFFANGHPLCSWVAQASAWARVRDTGVLDAPCPLGLILEDVGDGIRAQIVLLASNDPAQLARQLAASFPATDVVVEPLQQKGLTPAAPGAIEEQAPTAADDAPPAVPDGADGAHAGRGVADAYERAMAAILDHAARFYRADDRSDLFALTTVPAEDDAALARAVARAVAAPTSAPADSPFVTASDDEPVSVSLLVIGSRARPTAARRHPRDLGAEGIDLLRALLRGQA